MIIAVANQSDTTARSGMADSLAQLRAEAGRTVLLIGAATTPERSVTAHGRRGSLARHAIDTRGLQGELEQLQQHYHDVVIDTEGRDTLESRIALIAARLVIVPVHVDEVDVAGRYQLIDRLNSARMFNPGLRVVFVIVGREQPSPEEKAAVRHYVAQVMSATLAGTLLHEGAAGDDLDALYREVFAH